MFASIVRRLSILQIIVVFGIMTLAGLTGLVGLALYGITKVGIGGAQYSKVMSGKDLVADILPPPEYILEAYLEVNLLKDAADERERNAHIARLKDLKTQFDDRRAYWAASALPDSLRVKLAGTAAGEADRFWAEVRDAFIPAVRRGDAKALAQSFTRLSAAYATHRAAIDDIVVQANAYATTVEDGAKAETPVLTSAIALTALAVSITILGGLVFIARRIVRPVSAVAKAMSAMVAGAQRREAETKAQSSLDANLVALRDAVFAHGPPRREGEALYFGRRLINDDNEIVDRIKERFGCTATIFLGDRRIATNVLKPDGARATGTCLAALPVAQVVLKDGQMYRGEATIFDRPYLTLYEPILSGSEVIGILYVGVPRDLAARQGRTSIEPEGRNEVLQMQNAILALDAATIAKDGAEVSAMDQRYQSMDAMRRASSLAESAAADQRLVVAALSQALESLAATDFTHAIAIDFPEDYRTLKTNFSAAVTILRDTMRSVGAQAESIFGVSGSISQATDDLSRRTEQQAASLEQTAAALDEITHSVSQTAQGAAHARDVVARTKRDAELSGQVVREAVEAMGSIEHSSRRIGQIIGVIDEIAFQTNLLALNAGVEAARAGDAGRGFAVVASEVRALAQRSADAAKEIKTLISASGQQVEHGVKLVDDTGAALARILAQVAEINTIVSDIASSIDQQSTGLAEVNTAVNQMDQFTQQNAVMVEESAASSQHLAQEAEQLTGLIGRFRVDRDPENALPQPVRAKQQAQYFPAAPASHLTPSPAGTLSRRADRPRRRA